MSLQEKKALMNIFSSILIMGGYLYYVFVFKGEESLARIHELKFWARFILILVPVAIVAKIVIHIVFTILNTMATREQDPEIVDEFDKLVELKSSRNGNYVSVIGFLLSLGAILLDMPLYAMFVVLLTAGLMGDIVSEAWKIYYYRKGV